MMEVKRWVTDKKPGYVYCLFTFKTMMQIVSVVIGINPRIDFGVIVMSAQSQFFELWG